jgi:hypothetical protein
MLRTLFVTSIVSCIIVAVVTSPAGAPPLEFAPGAPSVAITRKVGPLDVLPKGIIPPDALFPELSPPLKQQLEWGGKHLSPRSKTRLKEPLLPPHSHLFGFKDGAVGMIFQRRSFINAPTIMRLLASKLPRFVKSSILHQQNQILTRAKTGLCLSGLRQLQCATKFTNETSHGDATSAP